MTIKKKISLGLLTTVCGIMLLFAFEVFYTATGGELMPLMEENVGHNSSEINESSPGLLSLLLTLLKVIPALLISFSVGLLILIYGPFIRNKKCAIAAIFAPLTVWLISATLIYREQAAAPWQLWLILLILVVLVLLLTLTEKK